MLFWSSHAHYRHCECGADLIAQTLIASPVLVASTVTCSVERFTAYHRRSYICKAGLGDVLIGAAAVISDCKCSPHARGCCTLGDAFGWLSDNGTSKASHIKDKLVEMAYLNENIAGTALAASYQSNKMPAGNFQPNVLMANVCKHNVTKYPYDIARIAQDLAGGLMSTMPVSDSQQLPDPSFHIMATLAIDCLTACQNLGSVQPASVQSAVHIACVSLCLQSDQDFEHDVTGPLLRKYLAGAAGATVDNKRRSAQLAFWPSVLCADF